MSAVSDLISAIDDGLPMISSWNTQFDGFSLEWQVEQIQAGHRLVPSLFLFSPFAQSSSQVPLYTTNTGQFTYIDDNNLPFILRTNNIQDQFTDDTYRLASGIEQDECPLVLRMVGEAVDDRPIVDPLADTQIWTDHGTLWAGVTVSQAYMDLVPTPPWIFFKENNEGAEHKVSQFQVSSGGKNALGYPNKAWKQDMDTLHLRLDALITASNPTATGWEVTEGLERAEKFQAMFGAFEAASDAGWQAATWYTGGYGPMYGDAQKAEPAWDVNQTGYAPKALSYDVPGPFLYMNNPVTTADFTDLETTAQVLNLIPAWEWLAGQNEKHFRELFFQLEPRVMASGKIADRHEVITPSRYAGWVQWLFWALRDDQDGRALMLTLYTPAARAPTDLFITGNTAQATETASDRLIAAGAEDLLTLTHQDYFDVLAEAVDRICEGQAGVYRDFWLNGTTVINEAEHHPSVEHNLRLDYAVYPNSGTTDRRWNVLTCDRNTPFSEWFDTTQSGDKVVKASTQIKVWSVAIENGGDYLVYAWTPCLIDTAVITVPGYGDITVNFNNRAWIYLTIDPDLQELESDAGVVVVEESEEQVRPARYIPLAIDEQVQ